MRVPRRTAGHILRLLHRAVRRGRWVAATVTSGRRSDLRRQGCSPCRSVARWKNAEWARAVQLPGWGIVGLRVVVKSERNGRRLNVLARRPTAVVEVEGKIVEEARTVSELGLNPREVSRTGRPVATGRFLSGSARAPAVPRTNRHSGWPRDWRLVLRPPPASRQRRSGARIGP